MKIVKYLGCKKAKDQCGSYAKAYPSIADNEYHYFDAINAEGRQIEVGVPVKAIGWDSVEGARQAVESF